MLGFTGCFLPSGFVSAAEIYSASLSLDPAYDAGGCALVSSNGYSGTDRQLFIAPTDAYYSIKDYSSNNTQPLITVEAFDPTTRLLNQALGNQIYLASGTRVLLWAVYTGGYGTFAGCTGDGATENVTMRIVGENFSVPNPPTDITAVGIDGGATISFTAGSDNGVGISNYQYGTFDGSSWVYVALAPADFCESHHRDRIRKWRASDNAITSREREWRQRYQKRFFYTLWAARFANRNHAAIQRRWCRNQLHAGFQ